MAIIVDVKLKNGPAMANLNSLHKLIQQINQAVGDLNATLQSTGNFAAQAGRRTASSARSMQAPPIQNPNANPYPAGSYQAYTWSRSRAAYYRQAYAQQNAPSVGANVISAVMRSRVGAGGQLMPLVMDLAKIVGPAGLAIAAAGAMFVKTVNDASNALSNLTNSAARGGLSGSRAASILSGALGVNLGGVGSNLMSGYGPIAAAGAGVNPFGGPFGDNNYNEKGLKITDWIRSSRSFDEARRRSELAGSPDLAKSYLLSGSTYGRLRNASNLSMKDMAANEDMTANLAILNATFEKLKVTFAGPVISDLAKSFELIDKAFSSLPEGAIRAIGGAAAPITALLDSIIGLAEKMHWIDSDNGRKLEANTKATEENTRAYKEGAFGGGDRARSGPGKLNSTNPSYRDTPYGVL